MDEYRVISSKKVVLDMMIDQNIDTSSLWDSFQMNLECLLPPSVIMSDPNRTFLEPSYRMRRRSSTESSAMLTHSTTSVVETTQQWKGSSLETLKPTSPTVESKLNRTDTMSALNAKRKRNSSDWLNRHEMKNAKIKKYENSSSFNDDVNDDDVERQAYSSAFCSCKPRTTNIVIRCAECKQRCRSRKSLRLHIEGQHKLSILQTYTLTQRKTDTTVLECRKCGRTYSNQSRYKELQMHHVSHLPFKWCLKCRHCGTTYTRRSHLIRHLLSAHNLEEPLDAATANTAASFIRYNCYICQQQLNNERSFHEHLLREHDYNGCQIEQNTAAFFECRMCQKMVSNIAEHILTHKSFKQYICKCQKFSTCSYSGAIAHVRAAHMRNTNCLCIYCELSFKNTNLRQNHYHVTHCETEVECQQCTETFHSSESLWGHMRRYQHIQKNFVAYNNFVSVK